MDWALILNVTFVGIIIVFFSLILLSFVVYLYPKLLKVKNTVAPAVPVKESEAVSAVMVAPAQDDDADEITAVIAAAIEAFGGTSYTSKVTVKSIRRVDSKNPVWNSTGRLEALN